MGRLQALQFLSTVFLFQGNSIAIVKNSRGSKWDETSKISYKCIQHKPESLWNSFCNDTPSLEFGF